MAPTLRITVEWLDGACNGAEWPPSPFRLYQAMIAGYAVHRRGDPAFEAAMRHLETLPPPTIFAPEAERGAPVAAAVPNNDGDKVLVILDRAGRRNDPDILAGILAKARTEAARLKTIRVRRTWRFDGAVIYDWEAGADTPPHLEALRAIAASVTAVGHGIDTAVARAELPDRPGPVPGFRHAPAPAGRREMDIPWPGAFDALEDRYRRARSFAGDVGKAPEAPRRRARYASDRDPPPIRRAAFLLRAPDGGPFSVEGVRAMEVAAMARHAIAGAAGRAGLDARTVSELMGHGGAGRIRVHPLPNAGHLHADGRVRRAMLTAPESVAEDVWLDVLSRLAGAELVPEGERAPAAVLSPAPEDDPVVARYCGVAAAWTTATPVVLPGHDSRRGKPRPDRAARRLLRHAGIAEALAESAAMEPAGRLAGSDRPARYLRPRHLAAWPCRHMSIRWRRPVAGPIVLGAGAGYGLGLFMPREAG